MKAQAAWVLLGSLAFGRGALARPEPPPTPVPAEPTPVAAPTPAVEVTPQPAPAATPVPETAPTRVPEPPRPEVATERAPGPSATPEAETETGAPDERKDRGLLPRLNLYLPEGQTEIRLSKLVKNSFFETQFEYEFVSGDIAAFLRYKYYASRQTYTLSAFDAIRFKSVETLSGDFTRVRGINALLRRPISAWQRFVVLLEFDKYTFSQREVNQDDRKSNVYVKLGYQLGTDADYRSNQLSGDPNDRIRNLFTVQREIGANGWGLSLAAIYGIPLGNFDYVKTEAEGLKVFDFGPRRLIARTHIGFFPYKAYGPPEESSAGLPYQIPGVELYHLDGRDALKGSRDVRRDTNEIHFTLEGFLPVFVDRDVKFAWLHWNTLYLVGYAGAGSLGGSSKVYTSFSDYKVDLGVGVEASFSLGGYHVFCSFLAARVLDETGSPKFLFTLRSTN